MSAIAAIAVNVFRESVRDKVLYNLVAFAILLIGASYLIGQLTAGQDVKIIKDLGLGATSMFGVFIAVFIGIGLVSKEVERRSIYSLLSKPIHRHQLVIGKYGKELLRRGADDQQQDNNGERLQRSADRKKPAAPPMGRLDAHRRVHPFRGNATSRIDRTRLTSDPPTGGVKKPSANHVPLDRFCPLSRPCWQSPIAAALAGLRSFAATAANGEVAAGSGP